MLLTKASSSSPGKGTGVPRCFEVADMGVKRIVPAVKPRTRAVLAQNDVSIMSPWYDKQRHLMLRDNLTQKERENWQK